ncbi:hypothetical protein ACFL2Y_03610 [Candidatus Omnitrophota bacterium]
MENTYSFLKDPRALAEIRKHKWIESQKANQEIGFATAAVDWIKNYGQAWKRIHVREEKDDSVFIERRKYRRFKIETCIELMKEGRRFLACVINANIFGLLCRSSEFIFPGKKMKLELRLEPNLENIISCGAVIQRAIAVNPNEYEIFLELDRYGQRQLALSKHQWVT